jgi:UDP-glucose 4-epimerase
MRELKDVSFALVLGAAGFIGRYTSRSLAARGYCVLGLGHGDWTREEREKWGVSEWVCDDITTSSLNKVVRGRQVHCVLHCAGSGTVSFAYRNPLDDFSRAVATVATVLDWIRIQDSPRCRFVLLSSAAIYGDQGQMPLAESLPANPMSPYGFNKLASEIICKSYSLSFQIPVSIVRLFSVYGEGLRKQLFWDALNKFRRGCFSFLGTGDELRDWIHVRDAAELITVSATATQEAFTIYNGGSEVAPVCKVLSRLMKAQGHASDIIFSGSVDNGSPFSLCSDSSNARQVLGWKPLISLEDGIISYSQWYDTMTDGSFH